MNIFEKIKSYFKKPAFAAEFNKNEKAVKESAIQVFQNYLKIKADLQISDVRFDEKISFKVQYQGSIVPFSISSNSGVISGNTTEEKISNILELIAVGLSFDLNLVEISQLLRD